MLYIFIGYLFTFFHLKINGFNFLPNFLGYIFIVIGLTKLANESVKFAQSKPWAIGMACITFLMPAGELLGIYYNNIVLVILNLITLRCLPTHCRYS